jgi:ComF family protein
MIKELINLFYPKLCCLCGEGLSSEEANWCFACDLKLPRARFRQDSHNPLKNTLGALWRLDYANASYYYKKGSVMQKLIGQFKYKNRKEIGSQLAETMANDICKTTYLKAIDVVIPVPLHPSKMLQRGFNQSEVIAEVIAKRINKPIELERLNRIKVTSTQTRMGRFVRWKNVEQVFHVSDPSTLSGKHILLIDDVFTTGATIAGCLKVLNEVSDIKMSVATIAYADY